MKKVVLSIVLGISIFSANHLAAQTAEGNQEPQSAVHVSFVPPLSTNGTRAGEYTNAVSFNILAGISKNETIFTFGGLTNIILNNANGLQMAGLANYVGNDGKGLAFAGLANITKNNYSGLQMAGLANYVGNDGKGLLFAGLANISKNNYSGLQFAGLTNIAGNVNGTQLAGLINIANDVSGVQFAGLVNIANKSDYPIGLLNIIKEGEMGIAATYNEIGTAGVTFRSGGRVTYGILGLGYNTEGKGDQLAVMGGFGAHINIAPWFRINNELTAESIGDFSDNNTSKVGYALMPAFRIGKHIELFGGPSINYMQTDDAENRKLFPSSSLWKKDRPTKLEQLYIGYQVGVQCIF